MEGLRERGYRFPCFDSLCMFVMTSFIVSLTNVFLKLYVNKAHLVSSVAPTDPLAERKTKDEFQ